MNSTALYELRMIRERSASYPGLPAGRLQDARGVYDLFRERFADEADREHVVAVLLDTTNRPIGFHIVAVGDLAGAIVHPREVFKAALVANAAALILLHNHPSGDPQPSAEDRAITRRLVSAGDLLGVPVRDHVVIATDGYYSFQEAGEIR